MEATVSYSLPRPIRYDGDLAVTLFPQAVATPDDFLVTVVAPEGYALRPVENATTARRVFRRSGPPRKARDREATPLGRLGPLFKRGFLRKAWMDELTARRIRSKVEVGMRIWGCEQSRVRGVCAAYRMPATRPFDREWQ
jgi:hypothetical protein